MSTFVLSSVFPNKMSVAFCLIWVQLRERSNIKYLRVKWSKCVVDAPSPAAQSQSFCVKIPGKKKDIIYNILS